MIRVHKRRKAPLSLKQKRSWRGQDVERALLDDQHGKCYLCERECVTDYQVDHLLCRAKRPDRTFTWGNLLLSCGYCNQKKGDNYDNILNPVTQEVEKLIRQEMDYAASRVNFTTVSANPRTGCTIRLLNSIFNGTQRLRTQREQRFYDYLLSRIAMFERLVAAWLLSPSAGLARAIGAELSAKSEFLGLKYWIILSKAELQREFGHHLSRFSKL